MPTVSRASRCIAPCPIAPKVRIHDKRAGVPGVNVFLGAKWRRENPQLSVRSVQMLSVWLG